MGVAVARNSVLILNGTTAANVLVGAIPGGLWVPSFRLSINFDSNSNATIAPVIVQNDDAGVAAHANGRAVFDRGETTLNGKPAVIINGVNGAMVDVDLPLGLLAGSGPYWVLVRGVGSGALAVMRAVCSIIAVPFEGSTGNRRSGDGAAPAGAGFGGAPGGSGLGGGGSGGIS